MRWRDAWVGAMVLTGATGCPSTFGRGGSIDTAAHTDAVERAQDRGCSDEDYALYCKGQEQSEECHRQCGD
jgi:hypothetical protein